VREYLRRLRACGHVGPTTASATNKATENADANIHLQECASAEAPTLATLLARTDEMPLRRAAGSLIVRPGLDWILRRQPPQTGPRPVGALGQPPAIMLYRNVSAYFTLRLVAHLACATLHGQKRQRIEAGSRHGGIERMQC